MFERNVAGASMRERDGLVSRLLLQKGDVPGVGLTATWVDVAPGARQRLHDHDAEQVYVVLEDRGRVWVGDEEREVGRGDFFYVPSGAARGMESASGDASAAAPAMDALAAYDTGQLGSGEDEKEEA